MSSRDRTRYLFIIIIGVGTLAVLLAALWPPPPPPPPELTPTMEQAGESASGSADTSSADTVEVLMLTADTKAEWVNTVTDDFNEARHRVDSGKTIMVRVVGQGSPGDAQQRVLDGEIQPVVWSPGDMSWIETANRVWPERGGY